MFRRGGGAAAGLVAAALAGCGPSDGLDRVPVAGKLTAQGHRVDGALVRLIPAGTTKGYGGYARTGEDGSFALADARGFSGGVVPGEYKVSVSRLARPDGNPLPPNTTELDFPDARETMPRKVVGAESTPLTITVSGPITDAVIDIPPTLFNEKKPKSRVRDDEP